MYDFIVGFSEVEDKKGRVTVTPIWDLTNSKDIMVRGGKFYAVLDKETNEWQTEMRYLKKVINDATRQRAKEIIEEKKAEGYPRPKVIEKKMGQSDNKLEDEFNRTCKNENNNFVPLDCSLTFKSDKVKSEDYVSKRLPYDLEDGEPECFNKLMERLYPEEDRMKIEWCIGAIVSGDSKKLQKFLVLYGESGAGKSTVINIIDWLFDGYCETFMAKELGDAGNRFAMSKLKDNPLVAYQHDGDLSRISDNTKLNQIISHEKITMEEKMKQSYDMTINSFLIMGTNSEILITEAKSGIIRRLIVARPGDKEKFSPPEYRYLMKQIKENELGKIANHCLKVYEEAGFNYYDNKLDNRMIYQTNPVFAFMREHSDEYSEKEYVGLTEMWNAYKEYCEQSNFKGLTRSKFRTEAASYFDVYEEEYHWYDSDGNRKHGYNRYKGFKIEKIRTVFKGTEPSKTKVSKEPYIPDWLKLTDHDTSKLDEAFADCPAQYVNEEKDCLEHKWDNCKTKLKDIDHHKLHHVKVPDVSYIVIDFDLTDSSGEKSLEKNLKVCMEAGFPPTYTEVSRSGNGLHLHYIYDGDPDKLHALFKPGIEQKKYPGNSSVRRKLTKCNDLEIAHIGDGLLKKKPKEKKMYNGEAFKDNKDLINRITRCINKEYENVPSTVCNVSLIKKMLDDAYESGKTYDVTVMRPSVQFFAAQSTNQANKCLKTVSEMHFKSDDVPDEIEEFDEGKDYGSNDWSKVAESAYMFFDLEVYPNKVIICYEPNIGANDHKSCHRTINPSPEWVEKFVKNNLIGFNNRMYDNHILYGLMMGYNNQQIYELSQRLVSHDKKSDDKNCYFREAYNLSFGDVYDFASAANKQSLKKWEVELGLDHIEMDIPWDEPLPDDKVEKVAYYCENDVIATRAVFNHLKADWEARKALAKIVGNTPMATTNSLTTQLIFGKNKKPQGEFVYTDLSTIFSGYTFEKTGVGRGKSLYRGEDPSEGGYVYAEPGMYTDVALLDVQSMHPASIIALNLFGDKYTKRFKELRDARVAIKHRDKEALKTLFDGAFAEYAEADDETLTNLSTALKTAINSVYGLTSALFDNPFRDPRNVDNIVAKRGALFMMTLRDEVQKRGFTVVHIKTDSIKIANATQEIIDFCMDFGKQYGYIFEHEATFSKLCLVNKAVLIGKIAGGKHDGEWEAVGAQFQHPFVYKTLFSHEPLTFKDYVEAKSVKTSLYIDDNSKLPEGKHNYCFVGKTGGFIPVRPEMLPTTSGSGDLVAAREGKDGETKYVSVTGTKGYKWYPSQYAEILFKDNPDIIDTSYYQHLVDDAVDQLNTYGDANWFME